MGVSSSTLRESSPSRSSLSAEAEQKQLFEALIRSMDSPPLLNVEESTAYIMRDLASNVVLRRGVKCLLRDRPRDPVQWLVALLTQPDDEQSCSVWTMSNGGSPALASPASPTNEENSTLSNSSAEGTVGHLDKSSFPSVVQTMINGASPALATPAPLTNEENNTLSNSSAEGTVGHLDTSRRPSVVQRRWQSAEAREAPLSIPVEGNLDSNNACISGASVADGALASDDAYTIRRVAAPEQDVSMDMDGDTATVDLDGLGDRTVAVRSELQHDAAGHHDRDAELAVGIAFESAKRGSLEQKKAIYNEHLQGKIIDNRFKVLYTLGVGGFGAVFACSDLRITRKVAIKVNFELIVRGLADNTLCNEDSSGRKEELRRTFFREGIVLARLEHPCILKIFHFGETSTSMLYQIMELIGGESLKDYLAEVERMDLIRTVSIVRCILLGLNHAHEKGVVHLDLKPANILLTDNNRGVKVIDWGSSQWTFRGLEGPSGADTAIMPDQDHEIRSDQTAGIEGTPVYMSLEQIRKCFDDNIVLDHRSDLFTVGLVIYECLTGKMLRRQCEHYNAWYNAFVAYAGAAGGADLQQRKEILLHQTELLQQWQFPKGNLDNRVFEFLNKALAINPDSRFASAKEMLRVFELSDISNELPTVILDALETATVNKSTYLDLSTQPDLTGPQWRRLFSHLTDLPQLQTVIGRPDCCPQYEVLYGETKAQLLQLSQRRERLLIRDMLVGTICQAIKELDFSSALMLCRLSFSPIYNEGWTSVLQSLLRTREVCDPHINELLLQALQDGINVESIVEEEDNSLLLIAACQTEVNPSLLESLLKHGAKGSIDKTDKNGRTPLHHVVLKNNVAAAKVLLDAGAGMGAADVDGCNALRLACNQDVVDVAMIQLLLPPALSKQEMNGQTPLHFVASKGLEAAGLLLLDDGADIHALTDDDKESSVLWLACKQDVENVSLVRMLLERGAVSEINKPDTIDGWTPLHHAVYKSHKEVASLLLDNGADIHAMTDDYKEFTARQSPVLAVACYQDVECVSLVRMLLERGAVIDINKRANPFVRTSLECAVIKGHEKVASLLLDNGADIHAVNYNEISVLWLACDKSVEDVSMVRMLLKRGAVSEINKRDKRAGRTPLHCAVARGHEEVASLLLDSGADIHALAWDNESSVLALACNRHGTSRNDDSLVHMLLKRGAVSAINKRDKKDGWTALHYAVTKGRKEVVSLLLDNGADIRALTNFSATPLLLACDQESEDVSLVRMLLGRGAGRDIYTPNKDGKTPSDICKERCYDTVLAWLKEYLSNELTSKPMYMRSLRFLKDPS